MNILAVDTCSGVCSVALLEGDTVHEYADSPDQKMQAETLLGSVAHLLESRNLTYGDLDGLAVATGPGGFTSLRVGFSAFKGIALASGVQLVGVSTLEAMAHQGAGHQSHILALMNASRGQCYAQHFIQDDGLLTAEDEATLIDYDAAIALAENKKYFSISKDMELSGNHHIITRSLAPDIAALAKIKLQQEATAPCTLSYIRDPDAKLPAA